MADEIIIAQNISGVDMRSNPISMSPRKLRSATNLQISEGIVRTRPSIHYANLDVKGVFKGATCYTPSKGLSFKPFAEDLSGVAFVVDSSLYISSIGDDGCVKCSSFSVCSDTVTSYRNEPVFLYQAENYLIIQNESSNTCWFDGADCVVTSKGISECDENEKSLNSFCGERVHQLANGADLGAYVHGRVHQYVNGVIFVSDIIHKRGWRFSDDILSMEEQMSASNGAPLSVPSMFGRMLALEVLPQTNTPHGEGDLIAYHEGGVVSHNTFEFPRESKKDGEGKFITAGWDTKRLMNVLLNTVSAVGRYAVAVTPRDHFFRSIFGLHWLKKTVGTETVNDEPTNHEGHDIQPLLDVDDKSLLSGSAVGFDVSSNRLFATIGMKRLPDVSPLPVGVGFVSLNRSATFNQSGTPISGWEGLWLTDNDIAGVHKFQQTGMFKRSGGFGFFTSDTSSNVYFAHLIEDSGADYRDGKTIPIKWGLTTRHVFGNDLRKTKDISDARLEFISGANNTNINIYVRTDVKTCWEVWRNITACGDDRALRSEPLGKPKEDYRTASWFQFKIEGDGYVEIISFELDIVSAEKKSGKSRCSVLDCCQTNFFEYHDT